MPAFQYQVRTPDGVTAEGTLEAEDIQSACRELKNKGHYILNLAPAEAPPTALRTDISKLLGRMSARELLALTNQLSTMVDTGVGIPQALDGIIQQTRKQKVEKMLREIKSQVESGRQLSESLKIYPKTFSPVYVNLVKAGEASGTLPRMLDRLASFLAAAFDDAR